jgi:hypothetical protein
MKKRAIISVFLTLVLVLTLASAVFATPPEEGKKGNGLPKDAGKSFNFNVIGVPNEKNDNFDGGNGSRIFVLRTGTTKFYVYGDPSGNFAIQDHDGTDGFVGSGRGSVNIEDAGILLPYDATTDKWDCTIYVRLLGPQDSSFRWKSDYYDGMTWVEISTFTLYRDTKFNVPTGQVLADGFQDVLWTWDQKNKFRICQFRIFVGAPEGGYPPPD